MLFETGSGLARVGGGLSGSWQSPDMGVPLSQYTSLPVDPLKIWKTQPSVRKVVGFAASQIASLPWHAFERVGDTDRRRVRNSVSERALAAPAKFVCGFQLIEQVVIDLMLFDRWCVLWVNDELVRIPARRFTVSSDWIGRVTEVRLLMPAGERDVDLTDAPIAVGWGWGDDAAGGVSPMFTLAEILDEAKKSVEWRSSQWDNAPKFGGILTHPATFKDVKKRDSFIMSWAEWRDGKKGTPILEDGMEYVQAPTLSPKDARDIEGRTLTDVEVSSSYHIPPELVGARPGNFSNMMAFRSMLFGPTLGPKITQLQQALNVLVPAMEGGRTDVYLEAGRESAINGSLIEQASVLQTMTGGPIMLRSEARARLNLPFVEGTDELVVPMNVTEGGQASPTDSGAQNRKMVTAKSFPVTKADDEDKEAARIRGRVQRALAAILDDQEDDAGDDWDEFRERWTPVTAAAITPGLRSAAALAALRVAEKAGADFDVDVMDAYLEKMAGTTAGMITDGTAATLAEAEVRSEAFEVMRNATAAAWAGSVVAESMGFGGHDAARALGAGTKTWIVTSGNPRPSHAAMDGETVPIDDLFSNGASWPGDVSLSADESAGCSCIVEYTF